jgi:hypothetical protein
LHRRTNLPSERWALHLGQRGKVLHLWEASTGLRAIDRDTGKIRLLWKADEKNRQASGAGFSADGKKLLMWSEEQKPMGHQGVLILVDLKSAKHIRTIDRGGWVVSSASLAVVSSDGQLFADTVGTLGSPVRWWDTSTLSKHSVEAADAAGQASQPTALAFSPDGELLAVGTASGAILLVDTALAEVRRLLQQPGRVSALAFTADGKTLATGGAGAVRLWEVATGGQRWCFTGQPGEITSLCFSRDSRVLASGSSDTTVLLWDVRGDGRPSQQASFAALWQDLGQPEAARAFQAARAWQRSGGLGVRQLQARLRPVPPVDAKHLAGLLGKLDSDDFGEREAASRGLEELGGRIEGDLRRALAARPSLEVFRRLERLLVPLRKGAFASEELRGWRAIEVLEQMASPEAERLLVLLADRGAPGARITREAKAALRRLGAEKR